MDTLTILYVVYSLVTPIETHGLDATKYTHEVIRVQVDNLQTCNSMGEEVTDQMIKSNLFLKVDFKCDQLIPV